MYRCSGRYWPTIKCFAFALSLVPLALLAWLAYSDNLGPDPGEALVQNLGQWGLRFLLLTLAVTPLRQLTRWSWPLRFRRMLGLFAFFYLLLHALAYATVLLGWSWSLLLEDFVERPYISAGMLGLLSLIPLAATSTRAMMRRLGRRWQQLHRLVYFAAVAGTAHLCWQVRSDYGEALIYTALLAVLLAVRLPLPRAWLAGRSA